MDNGEIPASMKPLSVFYQKSIQYSKVIIRNVGIKYIACVGDVKRVLIERIH
jgi:hypothetical protein